MVEDDTPKNDRYLIELDLLTSLIEEYKEEYCPISIPSLIEVIKLRMHEMGLTQAKLSILLNVSPSRISDYLNWRCEPTLAIAREISKN